MVEKLTNNANAILDLKISTKDAEKSSADARTYALVAAVVSSVGLFAAAASVATRKRKQA